MLDITKYGIHNKVVEVDPKTTFFIAKYRDKTIKGTGLDTTGWDQLPNGIVSLSYVLSTGYVINIPKYKAYLHLVEASLSIDKNYGGLGNKNYHYVYIKGLGNNYIYVHRIALRSDFNLRQKIGNIKVYTEKIPDILSDSWKKSA